MFDHALNTSHESDFAHVDWADVFVRKAPDIEAELAKLPDWALQFRQQRLNQQRAEKPKQRALIISPSRDGNNWIKKDNYISPGSGIRKQPIAPISSPFKYRMTQPITRQQYERHAVLQVSRLLSLRIGASPFTLVLDDLNQSARPLLQEYIHRAFSRNINVVLLSFETKVTHPRIRHIRADGDVDAAQVIASLERALSDCHESLVIIDSIYDLLNNKEMNMTHLYGVIMQQNATIVGVYHQDILMSQPGDQAYNPKPLEWAKYMATSIITCKSLAHELAAKAAKERSLPEPSAGILQEAEGVVQSLAANDRRGIVLETEFRRKSGRQFTEMFFLRRARQDDYHEPLEGMVVGALKKEYVILLENLPVYKAMSIVEDRAAENDPVSTFNMELSEKQREARENVVLPYFDAQKGEGGEGGRILYQMGREDDFDEEEDEI
ncbi:hypothetical protein K469DRAFT_715548 [Zopfia rhizophila CBS 207.26]|uniref:Elongator complex protein 5 n=1 Tax=Zopfia rhizophila CBS 207.26 TaxID=1314779 RepID=A0A6A6DMT6_9PEZI|nr:hypothetical protein K469DRAFT_715548 [Zopfia rhizophila CBS 207.26]